MNRFLLFAGDTYYPEGDWSDFKSSHSTLAGAESTGKGMLERGELGLSEAANWFEVVDGQRGRIILKEGSRLE